jgi:hypothetical protein
MPDIFISYAEEDSDVASGISKALEAAGFSTWLYERDSVPGQSYLLQVTAEIDSSSAIILIISHCSIRSHQITAEVVRGHESAKPFVPLLIDITHAEFQTRQLEWRAAVGAAASIPVLGRAGAAVAEKVLLGLARLGVKPRPRNGEATPNPSGPVPKNPGDRSKTFPGRRIAAFIGVPACAFLAFGVVMWVRRPGTPIVDVQTFKPEPNHAESSRKELVVLLEQRERAFVEAVDAFDTALTQLVGPKVDGPEENRFAAALAEPARWDALGEREELRKLKETVLTTSHLRLEALRNGNLIAAHELSVRIGQIRSNYISERSKVIQSEYLKHRKDLVIANTSSIFAGGMLIRAVEGAQLRYQKLQAIETVLLGLSPDKEGRPPSGATMKPRLAEGD